LRIGRDPRGRGSPAPRANRAPRPCGSSSSMAWKRPDRMVRRLVMTHYSMGLVRLESGSQLLGEPGPIRGDHGLDRQLAFLQPPAAATEAPAGTSVVAAPRRACRAATYSSSRAAESTCSGQRQAPAGFVGDVKQSIKTRSVDTPVNGPRARGRGVASRRDDRPSDLSTAFSWPDESVPAVPHQSRVSRRSDSLSKDFVSRASHSRGASSLGSSVGRGPDR
jgi:hypothetical protein